MMKVLDFLVRAFPFCFPRFFFFVFSLFVFCVTYSCCVVTKCSAIFPK
jgi:hypothetical protein